MAVINSHVISLMAVRMDTANSMAKRKTVATTPPDLDSMSLREMRSYLSLLSTGDVTDDRIESVTFAFIYGSVRRVGFRKTGDVQNRWLPTKEDVPIAVKSSE